jgi:hypothetical protein
MNKIVFLAIMMLSVFCKSSSATDSNSGSRSSSSAPVFYQAVYVSNKTALSPSLLKSLVTDLKEAGINAIVVDAQPRKLSQEIFDYFKANNLYPIARVVNFEGGLTSQFPSKERMKSIKEAVSYSCQLGFKEINLDYIRYSDGGWDFRANFEKRYDNITGIISEIRKDTAKDCGQDVQFGADIFGRVPFIKNDAIGQRVENFAEVVDNLYPMLYPSHFYGIKSRVSDPYTTVLEGMKKTIQRAKPSTGAIAWVQGFQMHIGASGLSYKDYIKVQMQASLDAQSRGFVVWNAHNDYSTTLKAFSEFKKENEVKLSKQK